MDDTSLLAEVELMSGLGRPEAKQAVRATLEHARAVIATLRQALPPKELSDLLAQLPRGYQETLLKIYETAR